MGLCRLLFINENAKKKKQKKKHKARKAENRELIIGTLPNRR
jgi:hypothetical protein